MELALTEEHMSCVTGMDHRLRVLAYNQNDSDNFKLLFSCLILAMCVFVLCIVF